MQFERLHVSQCTPAHLAAWIPSKYMHLDAILLQVAGTVHAFVLTDMLACALISCIDTPAQLHYRREYCWCDTWSRRFDLCGKPALQDDSALVITPSIHVFAMDVQTLAVQLQCK